MANPHTATAATRAEEDNERHLFRGHLVRETKLVSTPNLANSRPSWTIRRA